MKHLLCHSGTGRGGALRATGTRSNSHPSLATTANRDTPVLDATSIARQCVEASGEPFSLAEFRTAPDGGHWIGDGTGGTTVDPKYEVALPSSRGSHH
jgi:hypothetical protein